MRQKLRIIKINVQILISMESLLETKYPNFYEHLNK